MENVSTQEFSYRRRLLPHSSRVLFVICEFLTRFECLREQIEAAFDMVAARGCRYVIPIKQTPKFLLAVKSEIEFMVTMANI